MKFKGQTGAGLFFEGLKDPSARRDWSGEGRGARALYEIIGKRAPKRGEWFISGAIPQAYLARADLSAVYHIARPTHYIDARHVEKRGAAIPASAYPQLERKVYSGDRD